MKFFITFIFILFVPILNAQVVLKGKVYDDTLQHPLPKASVFIPELNMVAITDNSGEYYFKKLPKQKFLIQYTLAGYKTIIKTIDLNDSLVIVNSNLRKISFELSEVVVYGSNSSATEKTANDIDQKSAAEMRESGALNLSDGIAKMPGISQLSTGAGISKPVIRGLFGNRIQTVLFGLRFDNQQWQDEHGFGLSDVGIDRVEIIKGPSSLLYGSEAMGGVLNIIEEKPAPINTIRSDVSTRFFSNTYGNATDIGIKGATEKINWRIRLGEESHADYTDGNNKRVLNSRFGGYYAKTETGFKRKNWVSQNNYMFSQSNFGFLMDPIQLLDPPDSRFSRSFDRPHHTVFLNILSSQNTFYLRKSKLKVNLGIQNNNRQEQEGGNKVSLHMILNTYILNALYSFNFKNTEISFGTQDYYQTNQNVGTRTIIPDATQFESSLFSYFKSMLRRIVIEGGIRYDLRYIETSPTGNINTDPSSPGTKILPFKKTLNSLNGSLGVSWFSEHFNIKTSFSSGYRAPNLAELSSNGLHEGTVRYEIGNVDMAIEQNFCGDVLVGYRSDNINLSATAYCNRFLNYVYLAPSGLQYVGLDIFNFVQKNATLQGLEITSEVHPQKVKWINWTTNYSYIIGILDADDSKNVPFIPAPKINSDLKLSCKRNKKINEFFFKPGCTYVFQQDRPGHFETQTDQYYLLNASAGITITNSKSIILLSISGNNVLNRVYYDHMSRFKYFGIYNVGRNIALNFKISFN